MNPSNSTDPTKPLRFIIPAMIFGMLSFTIIAVVLVYTGTITTNPAPANTFLLILAALAISAFSVPTLIRTATLARLRRESADIETSAAPHNPDPTRPTDFAISHPSPAIESTSASHTRFISSHHDPGDASEYIQARALTAFVTVTLVSAALPEGLGLFGAAAYLITGHPYTVAAPALAILLISRQFPTPDRLTRFLHSANTPNPP